MNHCCMRLISSIKDGEDQVHHLLNRAMRSSKLRLLERTTRCLQSYTHHRTVFHNRMGNVDSRTEPDTPTTPTVLTPFDAYPRSVSNISQPAGQSQALPIPAGGPSARDRSELPVTGSPLSLMEQHSLATGVGGGPFRAVRSFWFNWLERCPIAYR